MAHSAVRSKATSLGQSLARRCVSNVAVVGLGFGAEFLPIYEAHPQVHHKDADFRSLLASLLRLLGCLVCVAAAMLRSA